VRLVLLALTALALAACVTLPDVPNPEPQTPFERPHPALARITILKF
jgi:hypothetical protein